MSETPEGIGSRKWSLLPAHDAKGDGVGGGLVWINRGDDLVLMEGKTMLARLTPEGKKVFALLATAPQLWETANEVVKVSRQDGKGVVHVQSAIYRLSEMVAKAVGKNDWKDVAQ